MCIGKKPLGALTDYNLLLCFDFGIMQLDNATMGKGWVKGRL